MINAISYLKEIKTMFHKQSVIRSSYYTIFILLIIGSLFLASCKGLAPAAPAVIPTAQVASPTTTTVVSTGTTPAYEPFSDQEKSQVSYSSIDFTKNNLDVFVRNVLSKEQNDSGKWAQPVSGYLFKYSGESQFKMDLWFPSLDQYLQNPVELQLSVNGTPVYTYNVNQKGGQEIIFPLGNITGNTLEITITCNTYMNPSIDSRKLAVFLNSMELVK